MITQQITPERIKFIVAKYYRTNESIYDEEGRPGYAIKIKHMAIFMVSMTLKYLPDKKVAEIFNLKTHCIVVYIRKKCRGFLEFDSGFAKEFRELSEAIGKADLGYSREIINVFYLGKSIN